MEHLTRSTQTLIKKSRRNSQRQRKRDRRCPCTKRYIDNRSNKGLHVHPKIRKRAEKEIKDKMFQIFLDEEENMEYKRTDLRKAIEKIEATDHTKHTFKKNEQEHATSASKRPF